MTAGLVLLTAWAIFVALFALLRFYLLRPGRKVPPRRLTEVARNRECRFVACTSCRGECTTSRCL